MIVEYKDGNCCMMVWLVDLMHRENIVLAEPCNILIAHDLLLVCILNYDKLKQDLNKIRIVWLMQVKLNYDAIYIHSRSFTFFLYP